MNLFAIQTALLFLFGSAIGSFINVIALRFREEGRIWDRRIVGGRSHCADCKKTLAWYELIPMLSFLIQAGRCRSCRKPISIQYFLVEALTGAAWVFVPMRVLSELPSSYLVAALYAIAFSIFILLALIDIRLRIIPDELNVMLAVIGALVATLLAAAGEGSFSFLGYYALIFGHAGGIVINRALAAAVGSLFFGLIVALTRGKAMGMGDVKFAIPLGILFGFPDIVVIIALAFIIGALVGMALIFNKKKKMHDAVPFGPFLVVGAALVFFFGFTMLRAYFGIFEG